MHPLLDKARRIIVGDFTYDASGDAPVYAGDDEQDHAGDDAVVGEGTPETVVQDDAGAVHEANTLGQ